MNLIVVGASHRSAPIELLEQLSQLPDSAALLEGPQVTEAVVLATCNRVEVIAVVPAFHAGLTQICDALSRHSGIGRDQLAEALYVHHGVDAVRHLFRVTTGLESMVAGEPQILGQVREAYQRAAATDTAGRVLHELMQQALRVGKRAHAETGIDRAPRSLVSAALDLVSGHSQRWLVVGAGAMGALAQAELAKRGVTDITVTSRTPRLPDAGVRPLAGLQRLLGEADVVVTATASPGHVLTEAMLADRTGPLTIIDLAMPRDVEPGVAALPGVTLIDIQQLGERLPQPSAELAAVARIVAEEVDAYAGWLRGAEIAPTVAALRSRAEEVVSAELQRLAQRRPELSDEQRAEVAHALHRVVQRLLHQPTVRVRQLASGPGGEAYPQLLRELFDLDTQAATLAEIPEVSS